MVLNSKLIKYRHVAKIQVVKFIFPFIFTAKRFEIYEFILKYVINSILFCTFNLHCISYRFGNPYSEY